MNLLKVLDFKKMSKGRICDITEKILDGGEGSGNFGHAGRPGEVGGSASNGSSENSAFKKEIDNLREVTSSWGSNRKAYFLVREGAVSREDATEAVKNGTIDKYVDRYIDALESNGDPTPTKPLRQQVSLYNEVEHEKKHGGDYDQARKDYIKEWIGCDDAEAERTLKQFKTWFGGGWQHADTETIDSYIDKDGAYDGEIYRGMQFTEDEYRQFMDGMEPGAKFGMKGYNSSWTTSDEMAIAFSRGNDRSVLIKCVKNKTSAPVAHLSTQGEDEVVAHSKTQWTVMGVVEGDRRTVITVMEAEDRMSDSEKQKRRKRDFGGVVHDSEPSLDERMNQQNKYLHIVSQMAEDGGEGSGNFGHKGRPGQVGGSGGGGFAKATLKTQNEHKSAIVKLSGKEYNDGTYDVATLKPVEFDNGYQVTFCQIGDNYSDKEYADLVNEFYALSSDGKSYAGKFESTPEVSFHFNSKEDAIRLAKKYNQISIWDWEKMEPIFTGGTGRRD